MGVAIALFLFLTIAAVTVTVLVCVAWGCAYVARLAFDSVRTVVRRSFLTTRVHDGRHGARH